MLKKELIDFCEEQLRNMCDGCCPDCNHPSKANEKSCNGKCNNCFYEIHYEQEDARKDYDCKKLILKYIPKYFERYSNNIKLLLNKKIYSDDKYDEFKVFSIGCGPAPDLNAFCELESFKRIDYYGFERNETWKRVHRKINNIVSKNPLVDSEFRTIDIFDLMDSDEQFEGYNVLIIQYLISHLFNTEQNEQIDDLFDFIVNNILSKRKDNSPFLIIINDIDTLNKGRKYFYHLIDFIEKAGYYGNAYAISDCSNGDLGIERWSRNKSDSTYGNISYKYITPYPAGFEGAALIIEVE